MYEQTAMTFSLEFVVTVYMELMGGVEICARLIEVYGEVYKSEAAGFPHLHVGDHEK